MNFCKFEKPSRYINNELNSVYKDGFVKVALAFPDIYDIGMSHLGLKILYKIINDIPYASAERVFSPWLDMEKEMKAKGIPLVSLEGKRPIRDFDIAGFSLQYELSFTTVLNMLSMSDIPIRSRDRSDRDPIVIAGGPCTVNPMPMSAFIDAFLIGDGEDAIREIVEIVYLWKKEGDRKRESLLNAISGIDGMYVPSVHPASVKRRRVASLNDAPYPTSPVVPYTPVVHDRINIEISRGCSMGCRFCQAGMIYRPQRERSPERILEIAEEAMRNTGYEEISLTSLSAGDYTSLLALTRELNRRFSDRAVSISLPSLRVGAVRQDVLKEIKLVRKTGFTMAPEAATQRLRALINKNFSEEDYEGALNALFAEGWESIKLYFMIGLPGERGEDIEAIPEMAQKAISIGKKYTKRHVKVNVGISPFVPKPHTPFQWHGQEDIGNIKAKIDFLKQRLSGKRMNFKGHDTEMNLLEAVFSRGDDKLSDLIENAWSIGCRLDAWTESFDFRKWQAAADATGINIYKYAEKRFEKNETLPWDRIDTGVKKEFLWREYQKAMSGEITIDCNKKCYACGLECKGSSELKATSNKPEDMEKNSSLVTRHLSFVTRQARARFQFSKTGDMRHLSHRELMTAVIRALRRTDIPMLYSQGFHPSPRVSFGPPLSVGMSGLREYFDVEMKGLCDLQVLKDRVNDTLPGGLNIGGIQYMSSDEPSLDSFISRYEYGIICPETHRMEGFLSREAFPVKREKSNGKMVEVDIRKMVEEAAVVDRTTVRLVVADRGDEKVRIGELVSAMFEVPAEDLSITRLCVSGWNNGWVEPLCSENITINEFIEGGVHVQ